MIWKHSNESLYSIPWSTGGQWREWSKVKPLRGVRSETHVRVSSRKDGQWFYMVTANYFVKSLTFGMTACMDIFGIFQPFVSKLGKQPAEYKLTLEMLWQLHAERCQHSASWWHQLHAEWCQHSASWWHQFTDSWHPFVSPVRDVIKTGHFYAHCAHFPRVPCAVSRTYRTDMMLNGDS